MQEARWVMDPGQNVSIVEDNWLASGTKATLMPSASVSKVGDLINSSHEWDIDKLRSNLIPSSAIEALKTPLSWSATSDHLVWPHTTDGGFSVKSGYYILQSAPQIRLNASSSNSYPSDLWDLIWSSNVPSKMKHFLWKDSHNYLPTS